MRIGHLSLPVLPLLAACAPDRPPEGNGDRIAGTQVDAGSAGRSESTPAERAPPDRVSRFTSIGESECSLLEENLEEGGYWRRRCPGHAGYALEWSESDLRQDLVVVSPDEGRTRLRLTTIVADGAFNSLGDTVEWRGRNPAEPEALIVRMNVSHGSQPDRPDISNLVVVRLAKPVCAVAVVPPGPGQNEKAREIADEANGSCLENSRG